MRLACCLFCLLNLTLGILDTLPTLKSFEAYEIGTPLFPYIQVRPPAHSDWVRAIGVLSLVQSAAEGVAALGFASSIFLVPRCALTRLWSVLRALYVALALVYAAQLFVSLRADPLAGGLPFFQMRAAAAASCLCCACVLRPEVRRRIQASLQLVLSSAN